MVGILQDSKGIVVLAELLKHGGLLFLTSTIALVAAVSAASIADPLFGDKVHELAD